MIDPIRTSMRYRELIKIGLRLRRRMGVKMMIHFLRSKFLSSIWLNVNSMVLKLFEFSNNSLILAR
jgi:hypothetical protein